MNRLTFIILLIFPTFFIGMVAAELIENYRSQYFAYLFFFWALVYVPLVLILRMRRLGFTAKEMLKAMVPFWGTSLKRRIWTEK